MTQSLRITTGTKSTGQGKRRTTGKTFLNKPDKRSDGPGIRGPLGEHRDMVHFQHSARSEATVGLKTPGNCPPFFGRRRETRLFGLTRTVAQLRCATGHQQRQSPLGSLCPTENDLPVNLLVPRLGVWLLGLGPHLPAFVSRAVVGVMLGDVGVDPT